MFNVGAPFDHLSQDAKRVCFDRTGEFNVLDNIEPTFAQFDLRDIGLRAFEPLGDILLSQPGAVQIEP